MKILNVVRVYATHGRPGGMIHVATDRSEALARAGHEVHVLTTAATGHRTTHAETVNGVRVWHSATAPQEYSDEFANMCRQVCEHLKPDVIHLESWDKHRCWWHAFAGKVKVAVTNHGEAVGSQLTEWRMRLHGRSKWHPTAIEPAIYPGEWLTERQQLKFADVVLATCRFDRWLLADLVGLGGKVKLVYNPLPPWMWENKFKDLAVLEGWGPDHVTDIKNPKFGTRRDGPRQFAAVGLYGHAVRGFDVAQAACKEAGVGLLTPKCSRRELRDVYDNCSGLLLPGFWSQGYDLCAAEALARQRPLIMSDAGIGTMEAEGRPWIRTFPVGDVAALAEILRGPLPAVPPDAADAHRPENHVKAWLAAVGC